MSETETTESEKEERANNLGRYFDTNTRTIFDDIAINSSSSIDQGNFGQMINSPGITNEMSPLAEITSGEFLQGDSIFNPERSFDFSITDVHRDAWIPCENTRKVLRSVAFTPGRHFPDRENLTMPGLTLQDDMADPTRKTAQHFLGDEENNSRNVLTVGDVTQDERGIRNLIQAGCYRAAISLTGRLLGIYGQGFGKINHPSKHTPHSLQLWYTRLSLLAKLRQTDALKAESQPFGDLDKPDMYFIFYPELYGTRHGSMASFAFRLLLAEIPSYYGQPKDALDNLYKVLSTVEQIISNLNAGLAEEGGPAKFSEDERKESLKLWSGRRSRVLISIVNCSMVMKNFVLAVEVLEDLCKLPSWSKEQLEILKSAIGRVYLFLGDVFAAEKIFISIKDNSKSSLSTRELIDRGLMAVAQNAFQEAYNCFKAASAADPFNVMLINNMAVCLLYTGQLKSAVQLLENSVNRNPIKSLQDSVLLNISTLYELHTTHSKQSKLHLLRQIMRHKGDSIDISCLKLT